MRGDATPSKTLQTRVEKQDAIRRIALVLSYDTRFAMGGPLGISTWCVPAQPRPGRSAKAIFRCAAALSRRWYARHPSPLQTWRRQRRRQHIVGAVAIILLFATFLHGRLHLFKIL
jgi:hypothetical protein